MKKRPHPLCGSPEPLGQRRRLVNGAVPNLPDHVDTRASTVVELDQLTPQLTLPGSAPVVVGRRSGEIRPASIDTGQQERQNRPLGRGRHGRAHVAAGQHEWTESRVFRRYLAYANDARRLVGVSMKITSGFRIRAQQARLFAQKPGLATHPDVRSTSAGVAIDHSLHSTAAMNGSHNAGSKNHPSPVWPLTGRFLVPYNQREHWLYEPVSGELDL
jgi:hypothetical protein